MNLSQDTRLSWAVTALAGGYVAWTAYVLSQRVPLFGTLFSSLGAELPLATRVVLTVCTPIIIWPATVVTLGLLLVKEGWCRDLRTRVILSTLVFMAAAFASSFAMDALFQPMMQVIRQIR